MAPEPNANRLPIALGNTLQLVLLLDGIGVAGSLGSVDQLLSKALSDALDVAERGLAGTDGEEGDGLVDAAERGHIDGLAADGTGGTDTGGVFTGTAVDDGVNSDLDGVLVRHNVDLILKSVLLSSLIYPFPIRVLRCANRSGYGKTYDLESVGDNADGHELLAVIATVHHERVGQALNDGALSFPEALDGIAASGV